MTCFVLQFIHFFFLPWQLHTSAADRSSFVFDGQVGQDAGPECHEGHPHLVPHVVCIHVGVDVHVLVTCAGKLRPRDRNRGFTVVRIASAGEGGKKKVQVKGQILVYRKLALAFLSGQNYTQFWQSWSSRRSCSRRRPGGRASIPAVW